MTLEDALFDVLQAAVVAAPDGHTLHGVTVLPTWYDRITQPVTVRVGDAESSAAPDYPDGDMQELDVVAPLQIVVRSDAGMSPRAARDRLQAIQAAIARLILTDPTLGGAVCDSRVLRMKRGWGNVQTVLYAVGVLPVIANETESYES